MKDNRRDSCRSEHVSGDLLYPPCCRFTAHIDGAHTPRRKMDLDLTRSSPHLEITCHHFVSTCSQFLGGVFNSRHEYCGGNVSYTSPVLPLKPSLPLTAVDFYVYSNASTVWVVLNEVANLEERELSKRSPLIPSAFGMTSH